MEEGQYSDHSSLPLMECHSQMALRMSLLDATPRCLSQMPLPEALHPLAVKLELAIDTKDIKDEEPEKKERLRLILEKESTSIDDAIVMRMSGGWDVLSNENSFPWLPELKVHLDGEDFVWTHEEGEEIHPDGKTYGRLGDDSEEFYDGDELPDAPELNVGRNVNLDELMRSKEGAFTGSFGRDEYEEYRQKMAEDFFTESDEAVASGDHEDLQSQDPGNRVFHDVEDNCCECCK